MTSGGKKLTARQYNILKECPDSYFYISFGSISSKWWICCSKIDKYLGGFDTKEEAEEIVKSGRVRDENAIWYSGNSIVM